ncbi:MAG: hypothetical protein HKM24_02495 [Gammaproteobacteria bacterium]|nr:hypothetical protein [Gammaproteobacteria bacterium]
MIAKEKLWIAISDFYLDTELQETDYASVAKCFSESGLSIKQLREIDLYEVLPALYTNLISPAGIWTGFDEAWLVSQCRKNESRRKSLLFRFRVLTLRGLHKQIVNHHWEKLIPMIS